jgi:hypothetical protein
LVGSENVGAVNEAGYRIELGCVCVVPGISYMFEVGHGLLVLLVLDGLWMDGSDTKSKKKPQKTTKTAC